MDILKKLRKETLLNLLVPILLLALMGVIFLSGSNLLAKEPTPVDLYDVPREELEGSYVTVEVEWIYAGYAYTEEYKNDKPTGNITQREYIIDANVNDYCALILKGDMMAKAEALLEECDDYYYGLTDEITKSFTVTGWVKELKGDSLEMYHEIFDYDNLSAEDQAIVLPLYLSPADYSVSIPLVIFAAIFLGAAVILLVMALQGKFQSQVSEKIAASGNPEGFGEFLSAMHSNVPAVAGTRIYNGYVLVRSGCRHYLYDYNELVWAYKQTTTQKLYGLIPIGKNYSLVLKLANGKETAIPMKEALIKEQLEKLVAQIPTCAIGYNEQLASAYRQDPNSLRQIGAAQRGNR